MAPTEWPFHPLFPGQAKHFLGMLVLVEEGKPEFLEKNPRSRDENQQQTQPTYGINTGNQT